MTINPEILISLPELDYAFWCLGFSEEIE